MNNAYVCGFQWLRSKAFILLYLQYWAQEFLFEPMCVMDQTIADGNHKSILQSLQEIMGFIVMLPSLVLVRAPQTRTQTAWISGSNQFRGMCLSFNQFCT